MARKDALTRRAFLKRSGAAGVAVAGGTLWATAPAAARARRYGKAQSPLRHVVISCQENRSFDHYFGYAPQVQAAGYGPPPGYTQPDAAGVGHAPYELTALRSSDPPHSWNAVHTQWNHGAMDGFYRSGQDRSIPYYTATELPYYYSLFGQAGLCANYFCSLLGPTWPNRF
jgi:phospholipase C